MLRDDLDEARRRWLQDAKTDAERQQRERSDFLKHIDSDGRVLDFHGTRHTYISDIVAGGASVKTCQELARHSTPTLTIGRYSHARLHDLTAALDALPDLTTPPATTTTAEAMAATGTDGDAAEVSWGQKWGQYNGKSTPEAANRGEWPNGCTTVGSDPDHGQDSISNVLALRDFARNEPQAANRGEKKKGGKGKRRRWESNPRMAVLQTAALATWLRRHHSRRLENWIVPVKRFCGGWGEIMLRTGPAG